jgi:hypothetical protein
MGLMKWADSIVKKMGVWDVAALKLYVAIFGVVLGAYISVFVKQYVWYFVAVFLVLMVRMLYIVFGKK